MNSDKPTPMANRSLEDIEADLKQMGYDTSKPVRRYTVNPPVDLNSFNQSGTASRISMAPHDKAFVLTDDNGDKGVSCRVIPDDALEQSQLRAEAVFRSQPIRIHGEAEVSGPIQYSRESLEALGLSDDFNESRSAARSIITSPYPFSNVEYRHRKMHLIGIQAFIKEQKERTAMERRRICKNIAQGIIGLVIGCLIGFGLAELAKPYFKSSPEAAPVQEKEPVVLGHRIGPNGQFMLVIKGE